MPSWLARGTSLRSDLSRPVEAPWGWTCAALTLDEDDMEAAANRYGTRKFAGLTVNWVDATSQLYSALSSSSSPSECGRGFNAPLRAIEADVRNVPNIV